MSLAFLLTPSFCLSEIKTPINRKVLGLSMGMDETDFLREHDAILIHNDAGHRAYRLAESPDPDIRQVTVGVFQSRVLKVDLEFSDAFVRHNGWFDLVWRFCAKYGSSRLTQLESAGHVTDVVEWADERTNLVLRHVWRGRGDGTLQSDYFATYADAQYPMENLRSKRPLAQNPEKDNAVE